MASDPSFDLPQLPPAALFIRDDVMQVLGRREGEISPLERKGFLNRSLPTLVCPLECAEDTLVLFMISNERCYALRFGI